MAEVRKHLFRYEIRVIFWEIVIAFIIAVIAYILIGLSSLSHLNLESFLASLVSLNSGLIVAVLVALFHSSEENIVAFREFKLAAKQVYLIFLMNSTLVCVSTLMINNIELSQLGNKFDLWSFNMLAILSVSLAITATAKNIHQIYNLLSIYFRN